MVSPTARRRAVTYLMKKRSFSERRACVLLSQPRGTQRYKGKEDPIEKRLLKRLRAIAKDFPRYGYRRLTDKLREEGWRVNRKRVRRLCQLEGLKVFKKRRQRNSRGKTPLLEATHQNHVWSCDFLFDQTANGRMMKLLTVIDIFTRQCYAIEVHRRIRAGDLLGVLRRLFELHGKPDFIRCDNGSEFIANQLREWLRKSEVKTQYIDPGAPWQNAHIESFHDKLRDECLNSELFFSLAEARAVVEDWRVEYNTVRPHSSLGRIPPAAYAARIAQSVRVEGLPTGGGAARVRQSRSAPPLWITHP